MPQDLHRDPRVDIERGEQRSAGVARVMQRIFGTPASVDRAANSRLKFLGSIGVP
ncbi:hypothetical protein [Streptomyces tubercidicus]|uniref:hypothetical protein n=1 Tax=Streptomyces tubercidicus TaxID=47759 RepID=UPI003466B8CB